MMIAKCTISQRYEQKRKNDFSKYSMLLILNKIFFNNKEAILHYQLKLNSIFSLSKEK